MWWQDGSQNARRKISVPDPAHPDNLQRLTYPLNVTHPTHQTVLREAVVGFSLTAQSLQHSRKSGGCVEPGDKVVLRRDHISASGSNAATASEEPR